MSSLTEFIVEDAALGRFRLRQGYAGRIGNQPSSRLRLTRLGYAVGHGPQMAPGEPAPEPACASHADRRDAFGEVVQSRCVRAKRKTEVSLVRSSAAEYLTFVAASGQAVIQNLRITATDGKSYDTQHYNLAAINRRLNPAIPSRTFSAGPKH